MTDAAQGPPPVPPPAAETVAPAPPAATRRARVEALFEVVLCSSVPTQLLVATAVGVAGLVPLGDDGNLSLAFVAVVALADTALLVGLMAATVTIALANGLYVWSRRGR